MFSRCLREDVVLLVHNCLKSQTEICHLTLRLGLTQDLKQIRSFSQPLGYRSAHSVVSCFVFDSSCIWEGGPSLVRNGGEASNFTVWIQDLAST